MNTVQPIKDIKTIRNMRSVLRNQSTRNELLFILGINVGLRISDILKLKFKDILTPKGNIKPYVKVTEKKTGKTNTFYIGAVVKKVIETYVLENQPLDRDTYIFRSRKGNNKPISRQQAWNILNNAAEEVGLVTRDMDGNIVYGEIGTHTLRKTFAYHAYQSGTSIELLMTILNHSSKSHTLRYIGITEEDKKEVFLKSNLG
ncbi:site-specific integrase (plasmid) [Haloimpatiens sp. FM7330]|uniref:site-specific integrase n=1 Tax=Haloimpatiens sp. FM7330 TaxID=3298610 RepID=UPI003635C9B9